MAIFPVLLDAIPPYLVADPVVGDPAPPSSLLLLPMGRQTLLERVSSNVSRVTSSRLIVCPTFAPSRAYADAMRAANASLEVVPNEGSLWSRVADLEAADSLLIVDPRCYPADGIELQELVAVQRRDPSMP